MEMIIQTKTSFYRHNFASILSERTQWRPHCRGGRKLFSSLLYFYLLFIICALSTHICAVTHSWAQPVQSRSLSIVKRHSGIEESLPAVQVNKSTVWGKMGMQKLYVTALDKKSSRMYRIMQIDDFQSNSVRLFDGGVILKTLGLNSGNTWVNQKKLSKWSRTCRGRNTQL